MSTMTEQRITPKDLGKIPRKVAVIVCDLVNNHDIRYKADGSHVWLYNGDTQTRPYKIAASRPEETTLDFLYKWIEKNVPAYHEREVTEDAIKALAEAVSTADTSPGAEGIVEPEEVQPDVSDLRPVAEGRTAFFFANGKDSGFDTDDTTYWCRRCDFSKDGAVGVHLHAASHGGKRPMDDPATKAKMQETRRLRAEQRKVVAEQAITALAELHGLKVGEVGSKEVAKLAAENERLRVRVEELETRLALVKEAFRV